PCANFLCERFEHFYGNRVRLNLLQLLVGDESLQQHVTQALVCREFSGNHDIFLVLLASEGNGESRVSPGSGNYADQSALPPSQGLGDVGLVLSFKKFPDHIGHALAPEIRRGLQPLDEIRWQTECFRSGGGDLPGSPALLFFLTSGGGGVLAFPALLFFP